MFQLQIRPRDTNFAVRATWAVANCPASLSALHSNTLPRTCQAEIAESNEGACPIPLIRQAFDDSPSFWASYQGIIRFLEENRTPQDCMDFLIPSMHGLCVLFSASGRQMPYLSEEFIRGIRERAKDAGFIQEVSEKLKNLDLVWANQFIAGRERASIGLDIWCLVLFCMEVYLKGIEPITPTDTEGITRFVEDIFWPHEDSSQ